MCRDAATSNRLRSHADAYHAIIGDCGIHFLADDEHQVELGITLSPVHQGRGLAAEAVGSMLRYVFDALGKHRVRA